MCDERKMSTKYTFLAQGFARDVFPDHLKSLLIKTTVWMGFWPNT